MQATKLLGSAGQSIWLDHITRDLLLTGTLAAWSVALISAPRGLLEKLAEQGGHSDE